MSLGWVPAIAFILAVGVTGAVGEAHAQVATGVDLPVVEHELANGMRFLVLPRRGDPTTSFVVQYCVGGVNEVPGTTGMVHLLEHILFKGTSTLGTHDVEAERALFTLMDSIHAMETVGAAPAAITPLRQRIDRLEDSTPAPTPSPRPTSWSCRRTVWSSGSCWSRTA